MPKRYSIADARANLPGIVHDAEAGYDVEITRRGEPVAVVVSREKYARLETQRPGFMELYRAFRAKIGDAGMAELEGVFDDVRDSSPGRPVEL